MLIIFFLSVGNWIKSCQDFCFCIIFAHLKSFQWFPLTHGFAQLASVKSQKQAGDCKWPIAASSPRGNLATRRVGFHCVQRKLLGTSSYGPCLKLTWCKAQVLSLKFKEVQNSFPLLFLNSKAFNHESHHISWAAGVSRGTALLPTLAETAASPPLPLHTTFPTNLSHVFMPKQMKNAASEGWEAAEKVKNEAWRGQRCSPRKGKKWEGEFCEVQEICWAKPRQLRCGRKAVKGKPCKHGEQRQKKYWAWGYWN